MWANILKGMVFIFLFLFFYFLSYFLSLIFVVLKKYQKRLVKKKVKLYTINFLANKKPALLSAKRACKGGIIMKKIVYCFALHELNNK